MAAGKNKALEDRLAALDAQATRMEALGPAQASARSTVALEAKIDISQEVARAQQIQNDNAAQDIRLKRVTLNRLFIFLAAETVLIFAFAIMQGTQWLGFRLDEWSFRILVGATIAQITGMLFVAVRYLFPANEKE